VADLILLLFIAGFVRLGWSTGLLQRLAGLAYIALSFVAGAYLREPAGALLLKVFPQIPAQYADMVGYSVVFAVLVAALHLITRPMIKTAQVGWSRRIDKVLGAVFGFAEAILLISAAIVILDTYFGTAGSLGKDPGLGFLKDVSRALDHSTIGQFLIHTTVPFVLAVLGPLLPKDIKSLVPVGLPGGGGPAGLPGGLPGLGIPGASFPIE
jgi:uncharacterized membrane protein required for colicin V production